METSMAGAEAAEGLHRRRSLIGDLVAEPRKPKQRLPMAIRWQSLQTGPWPNGADSFAPGGQNKGHPGTDLAGIRLTCSSIGCSKGGSVFRKTPR